MFSKIITHHRREQTERNLLAIKETKETINTKSKVITNNTCRADLGKASFYMEQRKSVESEIGNRPQSRFSQKHGPNYFHHHLPQITYKHISNRSHTSTLYPRHPTEKKR